MSISKIPVCLWRKGWPSGKIICVFLPMEKQTDCIFVYGENDGLVEKVMCTF